MKIFSILLKKNFDQKIEDITVIKDGFSWFAFFFSGLWFLFHRMWKEFFVLLLLEIFINSFEKNLSQFSQIFLVISFAILVALNANQWLCDHLKKSGYEFAGIVFAKNSVEAKARFFKNSEADFLAQELELADSILDLKAHRKKLKSQKRKNFFAS